LKLLASSLSISVAQSSSYSVGVVLVLLLLLEERAECPRPSAGALDFGPCRSPLAYGIYTELAFKEARDFYLAAKLTRSASVIRFMYLE
jgi:hypothetical protein